MALPLLRTILRFLRDAGFESYWRERYLPLLKSQASQLQAGAWPGEVIPIVEAVAQQPLPSDGITVYLSHFTRPLGIRISGARFISVGDIPQVELERIAIHEMLHEPFVSDDKDLWAKVSILQNDPFLMEHLENHDPNMGYNTFEAYVKESTVDALEQIISERLGIARPLSTRYGKGEDDGMHVLAPALYALMKQEHFLDSGESFQNFFLRMLSEGKLAPERTRALYEEIVTDR